MRLRHGRQIDDSDAVKWCDVTLVGGRTAAFDPRVNQRHLAAVSVTDVMRSTDQLPRPGRPRFSVEFDETSFSHTTPLRLSAP